MRPTPIRLILTLALAVFLAPALRAQPTNTADVISVDVLPGWRRADGNHVAGLSVRLRPGWKTYWRSAGAAGISPQFDWRGTRGARSVTPAWPTPTVFGPVGARSIGYDENFVLPLLIPAAGAGPIHLRGRLDIGVCADICLPARLSVSAELAAPGRRDPAIAAALADRPRRVDARARCSLSPTDDGLAVTGILDVPAQGGSEAVVFEIPDPSVWVTDATVTRQGGTLRADAEMIAGEGGGLSVDRSRLRITVIGERGAVDVMGCAG